VSQAMAPGNHAETRRPEFSRMGGEPYWRMNRPGFTALLRKCLKTIGAGEGNRTLVLFEAFCKRLLLWSM